MAKRLDQEDKAMPWKRKSDGESDVYGWLGVKKRINGAGLVTQLGGSLMSEDVLAAMRDAAAHYVDMAELQTRASVIISRHTGAEAGIVTSGASAALTMATAACLTGHDVAKMEMLPDTSAMPNEVIMYRSHRNAYDHAIRTAGAKIIDIGFNDRGAGAGVRELEPWEIEAAITPKTIAVMYTVTPSRQPLLHKVTEVAKRHNLPVIVDAAAQLPPRENLKAFIAAGASLVAYSGGKAIRGPQGTGILCGRRDLISAALTQQLDMDFSPETWSPPKGVLASELVNRFPHHGLGRGFKVDKESVVGLLIALEFFATCDINADIEQKSSMLNFITERLAGNKHAKTGRAQAKGKGSYPILEIQIDESALETTAYEIIKILNRATPPIHLSERAAHNGFLVIDPSGLKPGDEKIVADSLVTLLRPKSIKRVRSD